MSKVESDVQRVSNLSRKFFERVYDLAEERENENFRIDTLGVVVVVAWDDDGDSFEDTAAAFESKRHHVQTGILVDLLNGRMPHKGNSDE